MAETKKEETAAYAIAPESLVGKGVSAQTNPMEKPEDEAKAVFDELSKDIIIPAFNKFVLYLAEQLALIDMTKDSDKPVSDATAAALATKVDKELRTGSETLYKVLTDNNFTDEAAEQLAAAFAALHKHANKTLLDGLTQETFDKKVDRELRTGSQTAEKVLTDNNYSDEEKETVAENKNARHTHENKALLDGLTQADIDNWNGGNVLTKDNKTPYEPKGEYQPATVKFVLDRVVSIGGADMQASVYDPQNRQTDIFAAIEGAASKLAAAIASHAKNGGIHVTPEEKAAWSDRSMTDEETGKKYLLGVDAGGLYLVEVE